jgi:hypothetical protein
MPLDSDHQDLLPRLPACAISDRSRPAWAKRQHCIAAAAVLALLFATGMYALRLVDRSHREQCELPFQVLSDRMLTEPVSVNWLETPRLTLCAYGPGHFWATLAIRRVCQGMDGLLAGRLVSLLALLATGAMLGVVVGRKTHCLNRGLFTAVLYIVSPVAYYWIPANRVDALAVFFVCAAYVSLGRGRWSVVACAALIAAGSVVKQPAALAAGPALIHLLLDRRFKAAVGFAGLVSLAGAVLWGALDWQSGGYYLSIAVKGNVNEMAVTKGLVLCLWFLVYPFSMTCLAAIAYFVRTGVRNHALASLFCLGFVSSLLLATCMACKQGSYINYFLEASALGSVLVGICPLPGRCERVQRSIAWSVALVLVAPNLVALGMLPGSLQAAPDSPALRALLNDGQRQPILVDPLWIDVALASPHSLVVNEPYMLRMVIEGHCLDPRPLVRSMARGDIPWLVLDRRLEDHCSEHGSRWHRQLLEAMEQHYELAVEGERLAAYRYRMVK